MTLSSMSWTHGWTYFKESTKEGIPHRFHASNKIGFESVTGKHQKCKTAIQAYLILLCFALWSFIDFTFFRNRRQDLPPAKRSPPALLWYSFHGAGLELNLQHLRGLPVYGCHSHQRNYHPCTEPDKTTWEVWSWVYLGDKHMNREEHSRRSDQSMQSPRLEKFLVWSECSKWEGKGELNEGSRGQVMKIYFGDRLDRTWTRGWGKGSSHKWLGYSHENWWSQIMRWLRLPHCCCLSLV